MVGIMDLAHVDVQISVCSDVGDHQIVTRDTMHVIAEEVPVLTPNAEVD